MIRRLPRWSGGVAGATLLSAVGVVAGRPTLLLAAAIPLAYVAFGALSGVESPGASLELARTVEPTTAPPDRPVSVRLTVRNAGDGVLPDVRVVDGVPEGLAVVDGTPRAAAALQPGEAATVEYVVPARRGEFVFGPTWVRSRSTSGGLVATEAIEPAGDDRLVGRLDAEAPPLDERAERRAGILATDEPGRGVEFHSTREYRPEDPADRIDWRHYAKRGELATVNFREHRSATAVLVVDARPACRVVPAPGRASAVELAAYGASQALAALLRSGHEVGVAVLAGDDDAADWVPPSGGRGQRGRAMDVLRRATEARPPSGEPADGSTATTGAVAERARRIAGRAPPGAQLLLFSPLLDDAPVEATETWGAYGFTRSVFSPDVLAGNTVSGQYEQVRRRTRLARCQAGGARTVDWRRGTPLPIALEYALLAPRPARGDRRGVSRP